jgi:GntR family transcriptional regulator/MocR family aminotransferase
MSNGLLHNPGSVSLNATRIGFAYMNEREAKNAVDLLAKTIKSKT